MGSRAVEGTLWVDRPEEGSRAAEGTLEEGNLVAQDSPGEDTVEPLRGNLVEGSLGASSSQEASGAESLGSPGQLRIHLEEPEGNLEQGMQAELEGIEVGTVALLAGPWGRVVPAFKSQRLRPLVRTALAA